MTQPTTSKKSYKNTKHATTYMDLVPNTDNKQGRRRVYFQRTKMKSLGASHPKNYNAKPWLGLKSLKGTGKGQGTKRGD